MGISELRLVQWCVNNRTVKSVRPWLVLLACGWILFACAPAQANTVNPQEPQPTATLAPTTTPDWFDIELTDVQTNETFTMNDYAGKVVLVETMAIWCPNCLVQASQVVKLHEILNHPDDLISVSLDVDIHEDAISLNEYAASYHLDWHYAVAPVELARALGNLYSAEYLNPPLSPMLLIDRDGNVHLLDYGTKKADTLREFVEPYLAQ